MGGVISVLRIFSKRLASASAKFSSIMPVENLEEEGLLKNPNLELAQIRFLLTRPEKKDDADLKKSLLDAIIADNMAPFYSEVCPELGWVQDSKLLEKMKAANEAKVTELQKAIEENETNQGEMEEREANLALAEYRSKIGDRAGALVAFTKTGEKSVSLGHRLDISFHAIRIGLFCGDHDLITKNIDKARTLIEEGGDWDRRNRLKVYEALYLMSIRQFKKSANLFLDTVSTFTSYELMDYKTFVTYTVMMSMIALPRNELREKVIRGAEILEVLHSLSWVKSYLTSLYECHYGEFFSRLAEVETFMKSNRYLAPHAQFYVREMRILAYTQLLESYRSLTLSYMANSFGVSCDYVDKEIARFVAAGRLHCQVDRVGGIVETTRPDSNNYHYQNTIKQGDMLLNRIQKLSRVINI